MTFASTRRPSPLTGLRTFGFPSATQFNCLTSPLVRTPWPVILNGRYNIAPHLTMLLRFHAISAYSYLVSGSFQLPLRILFSFHSRYYCAIGFEKYLELEVCAPHIHTRYPTHATQDTQLFHELATTGLSPSLASRSSELRVRSLGKHRVYNTTSPYHYCRDSVCSLPFSIAFTNGISIDFFSCGY